jgi:hypothetical protein
MTNEIETRLIMRINAALDRIEASNGNGGDTDLKQKLSEIEAKYAALRRETADALAAIDAIIVQTDGNGR